MKRFVLFVLALCVCLAIVESAEATGPVIRRGLFGRAVVVAPFRQQFVAPQRVVVQPFIQQRFVAPLVVPQQQILVPQVQGFQTFSAPGGTLFFRSY
jgi:hypothetical protein